MLIDLLLKATMTVPDSAFARALRRLDGVFKRMAELDAQLEANRVRQAVGDCPAERP